jgi:hypothetical protein
MNHLTPLHIYLSQRRIHTMLAMNLTQAALRSVKSIRIYYDTDKSEVVILYRKH